MADLTALTPCAGLLPQTIGTIILTEVEIDVMTSIAPFKGQGAAVSKALDAALGVTFPDPGRVSRNGDVRIIWSGMGQAMLIGARAPELPNAATSDQTDAWAVVTINGPEAEAVLARLVPIDLRLSQFAPDTTARTLINHMTGSVTRTGPQVFEVMVMRSMAQTLVHELIEAANGVASRRG